MQAIADNYYWSVFCHLTHIRRNLLNWYPFREDASVLEIGCGMGALTGLLCDRCKEVTAVELSQRRAAATLLRCREKENLEIIVGNLNDIQFGRQYDYITLIGVLEYQGNYTDARNPWMDFLKKVKSLLKPDGKLLVAIENQYGLKYWCGAYEDHTGIPFDGINQYSLSDGKRRTFSKNGLARLIRDSGFGNSFFYYPLPDYKLPTVIYSQEKLPENENRMDMQCYYMPGPFTLVAQEESLYKDIIDNQAFEFFANSFLVECSDCGQIGEVTFASLSCHRPKKYQVGTKFTKTAEVVKFSLQGKEETSHLRQTLHNERELQRRNLSVWSGAFNGEGIVSAHSGAKTVEEILLEEYAGGNTGQIFRIYDAIYADLLNSSEHASWEENLLCTLNLGCEPDPEKYGVILKVGYPDMVAKNVFWIDGKICWFDQEWILEKIPAKFVLYRVFSLLYLSFPWLEAILPVAALKQKYGLEAAWEAFQQMDKLFYDATMDRLHYAEYKALRRDTRDACLKSIGRLLSYEGK